MTSTLTRFLFLRNPWIRMMGHIIQASAGFKAVDRHQRCWCRTTVLRREYPLTSSKQPEERRDDFVREMQRTMVELRGGKQS